MAKKNNLKLILEEQIELTKPDENVLKEVAIKTKNFMTCLNNELVESNIDAKGFVGGSFSRGTLIKHEKYDVDIFVRFDWKYEKISELLSGIIIKVCGKLNLSFKKVHGSRDYFKVFSKNGKWYFEVIPVTNINKPSQERNITDLSYFHVPYIKKKVKGLEGEVRLAKKFFKAKRVYGAETYVHGFSGYTIELLIIYYKSFYKMLKALIKIKIGERLVLDIEKYFKNKNEVFIELNESKLRSPIILIDPTYKERNALAALSYETLKKLQKSITIFLKNPKKEDFEEKEIDIDKLKKVAKSKKAEFLHLNLITDRQDGDIAGTKLKKFSDMLIGEINKYFKISDYEFDYQGKKSGDFYLIGKSKKEVIRIGPPIRFKKHVMAFKKEHMETFEKYKMIHAKIKVNFDIKSYIDVWKKMNKKKIKEMGVIGIEVKS